MATTKYQVLYRLMNFEMNIPVTNNNEFDYKPTFEFYTDPDHRIFSGDDEVMQAELQRQQEIISSSNQASDPKHDMLFVYDGTKKLLHPKFLGQEKGYVVRDWPSIRKFVGVGGDHSKDFVTLGADSPEDGGIVVCKASKMEKWFDYTKKPWTLPAGNRYTTVQIETMIEESTIFKIKDPTLHALGKKGFNSEKKYSLVEPELHKTYANENNHYNNSMCYVAKVEDVITVYEGNIFVDTVINQDYFFGPFKMYPVSGDPWLSEDTNMYYNADKSTQPDIIPKYCINKNAVYSEVSYGLEDIETMDIPGHYEDSADSPYCIKDTYKRIESSPWVVDSTVGSLTAALEKARRLSNEIGLNNVRVVKLVKLDQNIRIR